MKFFISLKANLPKYWFLINHSQTLTWTPTVNWFYILHWRCFYWVKQFLNSEATHVNIFGLALVGVLVLLHSGWGSKMPYPTWNLKLSTKVYTNKNFLKCPKGSACALSEFFWHQHFFTVMTNFLEIQDFSKFLLKFVRKVVSSVIWW